MAKKDIVPVHILQDTREPENYTFAGLHNISNITRIKLEFADYSTEALKNLVVVERKTKADLFGTLGSGRKRFLAELDRAQVAGVKFFYIVIEAPCDHVYQGNFIYTKGGSFMTKPFGQNIIAQLISFIEKHPLRIIPIFASDAATSKKFIRDVLLKSEQYLREGTLK